MGELPKCELSIKSQAQYIWLMMNKPTEATTTRKEDWGRRTVYDLIPSGLPRVEAIGRLDRSTTGLLLFTNDFHRGQALIEPQNRVVRVYQVVTNKPLPDHAFRELEQGLVLREGTVCQPIMVQELLGPIPGRSYLFTLQEGKKHEVKRMAMHFGRMVRKLHRIRFGPFELGNLQPGEVRILSENEVNFELLTK